MITDSTGGFQRRVIFRPGFNWIHSDRHRNYGIGSVGVSFILIGAAGAVQWVIGTEWFPASARQHLAQFPLSEFDIKRKPIGYDLGYHSKAPHYEGQPYRDCDCLPEGKCYYDGSGLNAELLIEGFLNGGDEWIWNRLEAYYESVFGDKEFPNFDPIIVPHPDERAKLS